jgi:hypothetical protein
MTFKLYTDIVQMEQILLEARVKRWDVVINKAKAFAEANYDKGYDFFVECYSDSEWKDYVTDDSGCLMTWGEVEKDMASYVEIRAIKESEQY